MTLGAFAACFLGSTVMSEGRFHVIGTMVGAIATHLFVLHNAPSAPLVLLALVSFVLWGRRAELAKLLGRS